MLCAPNCWRDEATQAQKGRQSSQPLAEFNSLATKHLLLFYLRKHLLLHEVDQDTDRFDDARVT